ncbi:MAG TPA: hypothetical protein VGH35_03905 [Gaiellaceae bacterium]|jgi:hypothetical protein
MADRLSGSGWFPTPPPKPLKAPSAATLVFGTILPAVAVVGAVVALSTMGHSSHKAKPTVTAPVAARLGATEQNRRQAFADCMKNMGAGSGSGFRGGGRFGSGGPSKDFRTAFAVCRSLVSPGGLPPAAPSPTATTAAPVA